MTDFSAALLSLREPMTQAPPGNERAEVLLRTRRAVYSSSPLSNPMLAAATVNGWPSTELLVRLLREPAERNVVVGPRAYFQLALPVAEAPRGLPEKVQLLGFDVVDGADSYLIDYGETPSPLGVPMEHFNPAGLLGSHTDAVDLARALAREWALAEGSEPQVLALYRIAMPTAGPATGVVGRRPR